MDFYKVPISFGMALAMNPIAMNAYSAMTEEQVQDILNKAHNATSEKEIHDLVASLANGNIVLKKGGFQYPPFSCILPFHMIY